MMIKPKILRFKDDGITPNNILPVVIYRDVYENYGISPKTSLQAIFESNNWTNNWRDIVITKNHYHSTTHEVIGIETGKVRLKLGGKNGSVVFLKSGDVILIPAGVGHYSLSNDGLYQAIGGYPDGAKWDMIYDEKHKYATAVKKIGQIPIPDKDPVSGPNGLLFEFWK